MAMADVPTNKRSNLDFVLTRTPLLVINAILFSETCGFRRIQTVASHPLTIAA